MKQLIIALFLKLKKRYPKQAVVFDGLMKEFDDNFEANIKWVNKTNLLTNKTEELFDRLSPQLREKIFIRLFRKLNPKKIIKKHPSKNAYFFLVGEQKFFYDVDNNNVLMPVSNDDPRVFPAGSFFENLPKLEEFIKYLDAYSMRRRKGLTF